MKFTSWVLHVAIMAYHAVGYYLSNVLYVTTFTVVYNIVYANSMCAS